MTKLIVAIRNFANAPKQRRPNLQDHAQKIVLHWISNRKLVGNRLYIYVLCTSILIVEVQFRLLVVCDSRWILLIMQSNAFSHMKAEVVSDTEPARKM